MRMTALKIVIAYTGYDALTLPGDNKPPRISHVVCWAHARRRLFEIFEATKTPIAEEALRQIRALYAVEAAIHGSYRTTSPGARGVASRCSRRSMPGCWRSSAACPAS